MQGTGAGVACCWGTEHFRQPRICLFTTTVTYKRFCYPELTQDRRTPSACRCCCLQESTRSPLQLACRQPQSADQHPATVSFPNTHWTAHDSALGEFWWRMAGEASREWSYKTIPDIITRESLCVFKFSMSSFKKDKASHTHPILGREGKKTRKVKLLVMSYPVKQEGP